MEVEGTARRRVDQTNLQRCAEEEGKVEARTDIIEYIGSERKAMVAANDSTLMPTATKRRPAWLHMLRPKTRKAADKKRLPKKTTR